MRRPFACFALVALSIGCFEPDRIYIKTATGMYPLDGLPPVAAAPAGGGR